MVGDFVGVSDGDVVGLLVVGLMDGLLDGDTVNVGLLLGGILNVGLLDGNILDVGTADFEGEFVFVGENDGEFDGSYVGDNVGAEVFPIII